MEIWTEADIITMKQHYMYDIFDIIKMALAKEYYPQHYKLWWHMTEFV